MMKKEMTMTTGNLMTRSKVFNRQNRLSRLRTSRTDGRLLLSLARLYSRILEEKITPSQALRLLNAQLAFLFLAFPCCIPMPVRILFLVWFATSLIQCRRVGLGKDRPV